MRLIIQKDYGDLSQWAANYIVAKIRKANPSENKPFVLGLPTGSTPIKVYEALVEHYKAGRVSFKHVVTFNMDEYVGLGHDHLQSYHYFMHHYLFDHIDIQKDNIHILDGTTKDAAAECAAYEEAIKKAGGIDLFLGGAGVNGHLAFNEPGSSPNSRTRKVRLTESTMQANSRFFENDMSKVPAEALTVGVGTVLDAKEVIILIGGANKAQTLRKMVEGAVSQSCPITAVQLHPDSIVVCDREAVSELRVKTYDYFRFVEKENLDPESQLG